MVVLLFLSPFPRGPALRSTLQARCLKFSSLQASYSRGATKWGGGVLIEYWYKRGGDINLECVNTQRILRNRGESRAVEVIS